MFLSQYLIFFNNNNNKNRFFDLAFIIQSSK